jgi:hypothetical protein
VLLPPDPLRKNESVVLLTGLKSIVKVRIAQGISFDLMYRVIFSLERYFKK